MSEKTIETVSSHFTRVRHYFRSDGAALRGAAGFLEKAGGAGVDRGDAAVEGHSPAGQARNGRSVPPLSRPREHVVQEVPRSRSGLLEVDIAEAHAVMVVKCCACFCGR